MICYHKGEFTKRVRDMSSQLYVGYTTYIHYISIPLHTNSWGDISRTLFLNSPVWRSIYLFIYWALESLLLLLVVLASNVFSFTKYSFHYLFIWHLGKIRKNVFAHMYVHLNLKWHSKIQFFVFLDYVDILVWLLWLGKTVLLEKSTRPMISLDNNETHCTSNLNQSWTHKMFLVQCIRVVSLQHIFC